MSISWAFYVDWNNDGDFGDANENITSYVISANWELGMKKPFQLTSDAARLTMLLDNSDKRFSPEYASGALYGNLLPQRLVQIVATRSAVDYVMYTGWIETISPQAGTNSAKTCTITVTGAKQFFELTPVSIPIMQDVTSDEVIAAILNKVQAPPAQTDYFALGITGRSELGQTTILPNTNVSYLLDTGATTFSYVGDTWGETTNSYDAIGDVVEAERGKFFFDRDGAAVFWSRERLITDITVDQSFTGADFVQMNYEYGNYLATVVRVAAYPKRVDTGGGQIWSIEEPFIIRPNETKEIRAKFRDPAYENARIAAQGVSIGSFTTSNTGVEAQLVAEASSAIVTVNSNATDNRRVLTLTLNAETLITTYNKIEVEVIETINAGIFGEFPFSIDAKLIETEAYARQVATYELNRRCDPFGAFISVDLKPKNATTEAAMLTRKMGDRIAITENQTAQSSVEYFIVGEGWEWLPGDVRCVWYLEPADSNQYWLLGEAGFSELNQTTVLAL